MSNISKTTFKELASPHFGEVFSLIDKVCRGLNVPVYLIGAHAKVILLLEQGFKPDRGTKDIDFAVMLPDMVAYENLLDSLVTIGFRKVQEPYRLIYDKTDTVVDLLPFGEIEEEGTVKFTNRDTELSVIGLSEVLEGSKEIFYEGITTKVVPLIGIVILKLISFKDKPSRTKDIDDIYEIITDYFDISEDRFYIQYNYIVDDIDVSNFKLEAGAFMVGIEIRDILEPYDSIRKLIIEIVLREIEEELGNISKYMLQKNYFKDLPVIKRIFTWIYKGIITE